MLKLAQPEPHTAKADPLADGSAQQQSAEPTARGAAEQTARTDTARSCSSRGSNSGPAPPHLSSLSGRSPTAARVSRTASYATVRPKDRRPNFSPRKQMVFAPKHLKNPPPARARAVGRRPGTQARTAQRPQVDRGRGSRSGGAPGALPAADMGAPRGSLRTFDERRAAEKVGK